MAKSHSSSNKIDELKRSEFLQSFLRDLEDFSSGFGKGSAFRNPTRTLIFETNAGGALNWMADDDYFIVWIGINSSTACVSMDGTTAATMATAATKIWQNVIAFMQNTSGTAWVSMNFPIKKGETIYVSTSATTYLHLILERAST